MNESRIATPAQAQQSGRAQRSQAALVTRYIQEISAAKRPRAVKARESRAPWNPCGPALVVEDGTVGVAA